MHAKHQFKHKLTKIPIVAATLFLAIAMFTQLSAPLTVHASNNDSDSMTNQDVAQGNDYDGTGISYTNTGWLFYLLDAEGGQQIEDTKAILSYDGIIDEESPDEWVSYIYLYNSIGDLYTDYNNIKTNAPWGPPFDNSGSPRGDLVREWLKAESNTEIGHTRAYDLIKQYWGEEYALKWEDKDYYLAFEPFYWGRMFKDRQSLYLNHADGTSETYWFCGTTHQWGIMMQDLSINVSHGDYTYSESDTLNGDPITKRYTNNIFPGCVTLDVAEENIALGYRTPDPISPNDRLANLAMFTAPEPGKPMRKQVTGYGLGIVWSDKESQTSTYDEPLTTPAPAPDDKEELPYIDQITEGKYANIVKFYEEHHLDTEGNLIEEDTIRAAYTRTPTPRTITIEDEEPVGYTVKEWFTSPTYRRATLPQNVSIQHLTSF